MLKKHDGLIGNVLRVLSANFWVAFIGLLSSFVFPKILTIDDYALYRTFTLYLNYITILHLGFPSGMVINYAGKNYDEIDQNQYKSEIKIIGWLLVPFTLLFLVLSVILKSKMLAYISLAIIPYDLIGSYKALMQAWMQFRKFSFLSTMLATTIPTLAFLYYVIEGILPGETYIIIFLTIYWAIAFFIIIEIAGKIKGAKSNEIFSKKNWNTEKNGIVLLLGNYINTLFVSADQQFVKWSFDVSKFAFYSFGMSMQALMTVFITSMAQPLFPAMAQGKFNDEGYNSIKESLIIFGSFSGFAYFAASFIVKNFIPKYTESLSVVGIYFLVFPAMAVVNCLYINLYKIKNLMKQYIATLMGIMFIALILNIIAVKFYHDYTGVSIATTITYYIWFLWGFRQFKFLKLNITDIMYLLLYTVIFLATTRWIENEIIGVVTYFVFVMILILFFYGDRIRSMLKLKDK